MSSHISAAFNWPAANYLNSSEAAKIIARKTKKKLLFLICELAPSNHESNNFFALNIKRSLKE